MIPILDNVSLVLCDKPVVKRGVDVPPCKLANKSSTLGDSKDIPTADEFYFMVLFFRCSLFFFVLLFYRCPVVEYGTTSVTTPSVPKSIESHQTDVYDENETAFSISRTDSCTYSSTMIVTVQKGDAIVLVLLARKSGKHKTIALIAHKIQCKSHQLGLYFLHKSHVNNHKGIIVFTLTKIIKKKYTSNIAFHTNKNSMLGIARMKERCLWESEQLVDPDEASLLSPPVLSFKNGYNFFMGLSPAFATRPVPTKILGDLDEEEEKTSVSSENIRAFLEQIGKPEVSDDYNKKIHISETIDTRDCTEDHYTTLPNTHHDDDGGWKDFSVQKEGSEDDDSSIASSSSSAIFELFDDVSVLTDEDSRIDREIDEFNVDLEFFEELSLMTTDVLEQEENDRCVIYFSPGWQSAEQYSSRGWQGADMDPVEEYEETQDSAVMQFYEQLDLTGEPFYIPNEQLYISNDQLYIISDQYSISDDEWSVEDEWFTEDEWSVEEEESVEDEESIEDEEPVYEESKEDESDQIQFFVSLELLAGIRNEEGFSDSDELRLA